MECCAWSVAQESAQWSAHRPLTAGIARRDEKERRARGLISHGSVVPLLASRLAQFVPAFRLGSLADTAVSLFAEAEAVAVAELYSQCIAE